MRQQKKFRFRSPLIINDNRLATVLDSSVRVTRREEYIYRNAL